jgi:4-hydroxy-tetrahydrodipicolinate reductase
MINPTPIVMFGAAGRMGRMILQLALEKPSDFQIVGAVENEGHELIHRPLTSVIPGVPDNVIIDALPPAKVPPPTVAIHFTLPEPTMQHLAWSRKQGVATLIGTTGFNDAQRKQIQSAAKDAPILLTPNTSRGVNVLFWLASQATRLLGPEYDAEIIEMHHHHKKDAPSGTARRLAEVVLADREGDYARDMRHGRVGDVGARTSGEVGMHALRGGDVVGEHTLVLAGPSERIELTHRAHGRELFASGALQAAQWLSRQTPGFYTMNDMLGL